MWVLDPNTLRFEKTEDRRWNSGDFIDEDISIKVAMSKAVEFIRSINDTKTKDTTPDLIVWDEIQYLILADENNGLIPNIDQLVNGITFLEERCYDIFKYQLACPGFTLQEIADIMNLGVCQDYVKVAKIALHTERRFKTDATELRKDGKNTEKTTESKENQNTNRISKVQNR